MIAGGVWVVLFKHSSVPFGEKVLFYKHSPHKGDLQWLKGIWLGVNERNNAHVLGTLEGTFESRSIRRLPEEEKWDSALVLGLRGLPWSYQGQGKRKRPLYTGDRAATALFPDSATLDQLARAAGNAAAAAIASHRPADEAGSDPTSSSSPSSSSSSSKSCLNSSQAGNQQPQQEQGNQQQPPASRDAGDHSDQQPQQERGHQQQPPASRDTGDHGDQQPQQERGNQ